MEYVTNNKVSSNRPAAQKVRRINVIEEDKTVEKRKRKSKHIHCSYNQAHQLQLQWDTSIYHIIKSTSRMFSYSGGHNQKVTSVLLIRITPERPSKVKSSENLSHFQLHVVEEINKGRARAQSER